MKTIMITAPSSNTGKTTLTLGIIRALKNRGLDISAFKTGPDYIDTKYLSMASGKTAGNLDMHMMGRENLPKALSINKGDYAVIEGAMGYFDGIFNSYENSSYDISRELDLGAILVYSPKGEMFSAIPKIKGMVDFSQGRIKAIILNKCSKSSYLLLRAQIEKYVGIRVLGHMPLREELELDSASLGLDDSDDQAMEDMIQATSVLIEENIDLDGLLDLMGDVELSDYSLPRRPGLKIAIARDQAFSFHYSENLKILEDLAEVEYFSPLEDQELGEADLVFIGGGYVENYLDQLAGNKSMMDSIRAYVEAGGYLIAEGGGFMYLTNSIESKEMLGIFSGEAELINKLERFGYINIDILEDSPYGRAGTRLLGNEYHKSRVRMDMEPIFHISKPRSKKTWQCGYQYKNALGYYGHLNFLGNIDSLNYLLSLIEKEVD